MDALIDKVLEAFLTGAAQAASRTAMTSLLKRSVSPKQPLSVPEFEALLSRLAAEAGFRKFFFVSKVGGMGFARWQSDFTGQCHINVRHRGHSVVFSVQKHGAFPQDKVPAGLIQYLLRRNLELVFGQWDILTGIEDGSVTLSCQHTIEYTNLNKDSFCETIVRLAVECVECDPHFITTE